MREEVILEALGSAAAILDERGVIVHANTAWTSAEWPHERVGVPSRVGDDFFRACGSSASAGLPDALRLVPLIHAVLRSERPTALLDYQAPGGEYFHVRLSLIEEDGARFVLVVQEDVTPLRRAQQAVTRFRAIGRQSRDVLLQWDPVEPRVLYVNPCYEAVFGRSCTSLYQDALSFLEAVAEEDRERVAAWRKEVSPEPRRIGYRVRRPDGSARWMSERVTPVLDTKGHLQFLAATIEDVTEQRLEEEARERVHRQHRQILDSVREGIIGVDRLGCITFVNRAVTAMLGWDEAEMQGHDCHSLLHSLDEQGEPYPAEACATAVGMREGRAVAPLETTLHRHDGSSFPAEVALSPIAGAEAPEGSVLVIRDLSQTRQLEEQFRQAQKLEALGRLAGGVAHDFNNLLSVIVGYTDMMLLRGDLGDTTLDWIRQVREAGEQATNLARQLLLFSRRDVPSTQIVDLNGLVEGIERMVQRMLGEDIQVTVTLSPEACAVKADPGHLQQVLMNLVVNARDAMPEGGELHLETSLLPTDLPDGCRVLLRVADTGCGMDESVRSRIFEPFFTTKGREQGTGLGLSTVYGIVRQSGGRIEVQSAPAEGTTFSLFFPLAVEQPWAEAERAVEPSREGRETVLLVEDEQLVRELMRVLLTTSGYRVLVAADGEAALQLCRKQRNTIHLLLTDVVMPGMSGFELAERVRVMRPETKVLFMSGYAEEVLVQHGQLPPSALVLRKPVTLRRLAEQVRVALETP